jgi:exopolyphosphatase/guanosine-5'-triphosphate,3'-diphosphate pyrophosphatase
MAARLAAVDFGSNTVGYLVADVHGTRLEEVAREGRFVRLAEQVACRGRLDPAVLERTLRWVGQMGHDLRGLGVGRVRAVGTAALRQARNAGDLCARVPELLGCPLEVIDGLEEAATMFRGVRLAYPEGPLAVIDVGGGSTELGMGLAVGAAAAGSGGPDPEVVSLPLGVVALTERHGESWPGLCEAVQATLGAWSPPRPASEELTVLGGTGANLFRLDRAPEELPDSAIEGHLLSLPRLEELRRAAAARTVEERVGELGIPPRRADVMMAGLAIVETAAEVLGVARIRVSRCTLRHGVLAGMMGS